MKMKKLIFLISIFIYASCTKTTYKQPFIIVFKNCDNWYGVGNAEYSYQDIHGNINNFRDHCNKYNIGDTLK